MNLQPHVLSPAELDALTPATFTLAPIFADRAVMRPPEGGFLVIRDNGSYAACAGFRRTAPRACELLHFTVNPRYRGKGLGTRLMKAVLLEAQRAGYMRILSHIEPWCPEWRAFYAAHGFEFLDPDDANNRTGSAAVALTFE